MCFFHGAFGLPKDGGQARYWLRKVADGECEYKEVTDEGRAEAAGFLRELVREES